MKPSISVVTPSFNQGRFIGRTLESVLTQGISDLEYVVFDGGSKDETVEVLKGYGDRVRWVSESDQGQAHAVNKGIRATNGEIIGWLNSDDIYCPGALQKVLTFFQEHPEVELLYGDANHIDENDGLIEKYYTQAWDWEKFKEVCFISQPATFFSRSLADRIGLLDQSLHYCMDYEYWIRAAKSGARIAWLPELLAGSRLYASTKTLGAAVKVHAEINDMLGRSLGQVPDRWICNYVHVVLRERGIGDQSLRFAGLYPIHGALASLRWNHAISAPLRRHFGDTLAAAARGAAQRLKGHG